jgi:hypothetical protein
MHALLHPSSRPTMLHTTNPISSEQANPTQHALDQVTRLLHYCVAFPDNSIVFRKSRMHLIQQTASGCILPLAIQVQIRCWGHLLL